MKWMQMNNSGWNFALECCSISSRRYIGNRYPLSKHQAQEKMRNYKATDQRWTEKTELHWISLNANRYIGLYWYILVNIGIYWHILVFTGQVEKDARFRTCTKDRFNLEMECSSDKKLLSSKKWCAGCRL